LTRNVYEGMYILDSNRYGRDPEAVSGQIQEMVEKAGGEMLVHRLWEERRLAYPIKGQRKGTYWLTYFRLDSSQLATIRRQCQLNENILRMLFLKVDPRIVEALVTHAQTATFVPTAEAAEEGTERKGKEKETVEVVIDAIADVPEDLDADVEEEEV
jgi:small subunit ribosomal protein S6